MEKTSNIDPAFALVDSVASPPAHHLGQRVGDAGRNLGVGTSPSPEQGLEGEFQLTAQRSDNGRDFVVGNPAMDSLDDHCRSVYWYEGQMVDRGAFPARVHITRQFRNVGMQRASWHGWWFVGLGFDSDFEFDFDVAVCGHGLDH
jgi:hypothetical protein